MAVAVDGNIAVGTSGSGGHPHAFAYDLSAATPKMVDLGTLPGGVHSWASAVDGNIVVGRADAADNLPHAFAYDLGATNPKMLDLGTLSGHDFWGAAATAVDGTVVVGRVWVAGQDASRAFAYDLSSATPKMQDLGILPGGGSSEATAVDGSIVVGRSQTVKGFPYFDPDGRDHAFAYDLSSATPKMRDLGTLPGRASSEATAVDGRIVVGYSSSADYYYNRRAFAYDLGSATPGMRDLGTLPGGSSSSATAVDGTIVVGAAQTAMGFPVYDKKGRNHAFAYDLGAATPKMRSLGTLGGETSEATDVDEKVVVGSSERAGDGERHAIAYDLAASTPQMTDLGSCDGFFEIEQFPYEGELFPCAYMTISGNITAGAIPVEDYHAHAVVRTLSRTSAPALRFGAFNTSAQENTRTASITVTRAGDTNPVVSVQYAASTGDTPVAGKDFGATSGTLSFAAGQTQKSFTVPIINDTLREGPETILLTLGAPTGGAILGTPNAAGLIIRASDQQPDGLISTRPARGYIGNNVYNNTGRLQTKMRSAPRRHLRNFYVRVHNDGSATNTFTLRGSAASPRSRVRYYSAKKNRTRVMRSPAGWKVTLNPGANKLIRVQIKIGPRAALGSRKAAAVRATWVGDGIRTDLVKAIVRVRR